jgi:hypothetical protein
MASSQHGRHVVRPLSLPNAWKRSIASTCIGTTCARIRLVERGVPLAQVRDLLGPASILTTERYDNQTLENLQAAAAKLEAGKTFEAPASADSGQTFNFLSRRPAQAV